jgi:hypothetical protein
MVGSKKVFDLMKKGLRLFQKPQALLWIDPWIHEMIE